MSSWSGVPNRSTQAHICVGRNTPCNDRMILGGRIRFQEARVYMLGEYIFGQEGLDSGSVSQSNMDVYRRVYYGREG